MGGGGAIRTATKVAGISVVNSGLRGRKASDEGFRSILTQDGRINAAVQRLCWGFDDREFSGGEEEVIVRSDEVFGGGPTLEEAKEATSELKDALNKVYLSSSNPTGGADTCIAGHESDFSMLSKSEVLEPKACDTSEVRAMTVQQNAIKAFRLLNESEVVQSIVASIASDPNVWQAVLQNEALLVFSQSHKNNMEPVVADEKDHESPKSVDSSCDVSTKFAYSGKGVTAFLEGVKTTVVEMVSNLSHYFENLFGGGSVTEIVPKNKVGSAGISFSDGAMAASLMGLAVMVIMVVVLKRG